MRQQLFPLFISVKTPKDTRLSRLTTADQFHKPGYTETASRLFLSHSLRPSHTLNRNLVLNLVSTRFADLLSPPHSATLPDGNLFIGMLVCCHFARLGRPLHSTGSLSGICCRSSAPCQSTLFSFNLQVIMFGRVSGGSFALSSDTNLSLHAKYAQ